MKTTSMTTMTMALEGPRHFYHLYVDLRFSPGGTSYFPAPLHLCTLTLITSSILHALP